MRVMFKARKRTRGYDDQGRKLDLLPIGLLVHPTSFTETDVHIIDLTTGCEFVLNRKEFETNFERF